MKEEYMLLAIKEAEKAYKKNEIPVGAIIVQNDKIIAKSYNNRQKKNNVLGHAEIIGILKAEKKIKDWRLDDCVMYVTLEPCEMCKKIIDISRIKKIYYILSKDGKEITDDVNQKIYNEYKNLFDNYFEKLRSK